MNPKSLDTPDIRWINTIINGKRKQKKKQFVFTCTGENGISVITITTISSELRQSYKSNSNLWMV